MLCPVGAQAVMELGATVCTVHQPPDCAGCPINRQCQAYGAVLAHQQSGGVPGDADAPPSVTAYPSKASHAENAVALPCRHPFSDVAGERCMGEVMMLCALVGLPRSKRPRGASRQWRLACWKCAPHLEGQGAASCCSCRGPRMGCWEVCRTSLPMALHPADLPCLGASPAPC